MTRVLIQIDITGDPGMVEAVTDEIIASINYMDVEEVGLKIENIEVLQ